MNYPITNRNHTTAGHSLEAQQADPTVVLVRVVEEVRPLINVAATVHECSPQAPIQVLVSYDAKGA